MSSWSSSSFSTGASTTARQTASCVGSNLSTTGGFHLRFGPEFFARRLAFSCLILYSRSKRSRRSLAVSASAA